MNKTKQYEFYHNTSKLKVLKSKENLLFKIIQFLLLRIRTSKADPDPNKIRPDPQHWTQGILQQCR